jgi:hypothetical protein
MATQDKRSADLSTTRHPAPRITVHAIHARHTLSPRSESPTADADGVVRAESAGVARCGRRAAVAAIASSNSAATARSAGGSSSSSAWRAHRI